MTPRTVSEALASGARELRKHRCAASVPEREALTLFAHAAGRPEEDVRLDPRRETDARTLRRFSAALRRRVGHVPIARITGGARFLGRTFRVDASTLIPRIATERIVEEAVAAANRYPDPAVIDVGTGSGCIAISVALDVPSARVAAIDASGPALRMARRNARDLGARRVGFLHGEGLAPVERALARRRGRALVVAANLPYLPARLWRTLPPDIRRHEPRAALISGRDGLDAYRALLGSPSLKRHRGPLHLLLECLPAQAAALTALLSATLPNAAVAPIRNVSGIAVGVHARADRRKT